MDDPNQGRAYSATVRLWMECDGHTIPLAQVAPNWVISRTPRDLPPTEGRVFVEIDGDVVARHVVLPQGMSRNSEQVVVVAHDAASMNEAVPGEARNSHA